MKPDPTARRRLIAAALLLPYTLPAVQAQEDRPKEARRARPLRVAAATAVVDAGLARRLQLTLARDMGLATEWVRMSSSDALRAAEQGALDMAVTHAPELELPLDREGLVHDRRLLGTTDYVLVGPVAAKGRDRGKDPVGLKGGQDVVDALRRLAAAGAEGAARVVSAGPGTGTFLREAALWKAAGVAPQAPWHTRAPGGSAEAVAAALAADAYLLIDRLSWTARGAKSHAVLVQGDARLEDAFHAMRSFRSPHPAGKLVMNWLAGPSGRRLLAAAGLKQGTRA